MIYVCQVEDFEDESIVQAKGKDGHLYAVYRLADDFYATDDLCTHGDGWLSEGEVMGLEIVCPLHGGVFNICTGAATQSPCHVPLKTYPVLVDDGKLYIGNVN